ncbi:MAG: hypothetical protein Q9157_007266 [Trypethelium eluteriae]
MSLPEHQDFAVQPVNGSSARAASLSNGVTSGATNGVTNGGVNGVANGVVNGVRNGLTKTLNLSTMNPTQSQKPRMRSKTNSAKIEGEPRARTFSRDANGSSFPRIGRPVELLRHSYDVVVIGSGYGGGVAASRMARGGQSVCLLERGKERWPGEFPTSFKDAATQIHVTGDENASDERSVPIDRGNPTGLYHLMIGEGQNAFVGNDYDRAEKMLEPETYPENLPEPLKLKLLREQTDLVRKYGRKEGWDPKFYRVPQTTKFADGRNSTGIEMKASTLTGQDSTGINDGSKTTTLVTYLADAWNWGAEIFCECEVRLIKKHPKEGYLVFFAWHGSRRDAFKEEMLHDLMWVHAKKFVFLGAGTLGTTEIMLRSKERGLPLSDRVGQDMSGNGDLLAFGYNTNAEVNAMGHEDPNPDNPVGPTITGVIDCREQENPLDGFVIEEGAVPRALTHLLQPLLLSLPGKIFPPSLTAVEKQQQKLAAWKSTLLGPYHAQGSLARTQVYLIMSHDANQARMTLKHNKPALEFLGVGRQKHLEKLNDLMSKMTNSSGGTFIQNPFYADFNQQEITVHPVGGMSMSVDGTPEEGATTQFGEVLTGKGNEIYEGLIVVDGALVPTALGVNPFATITALAERSVAAAARKKGITIDYDTVNGPIDPYGNPTYVPSPDHFDDLAAIKKAEAEIDEARAAGKAGTIFTEVMKGYIHIGDEIDDFEVAFDQARSETADAHFYLSVHAWDTNELVSRADHQAMLTGTFSNGMEGSPFMVSRGDFHLFNEDHHAPDQTNLTYDFDMIGTNDEVIHFNGIKVVNPTVAFSISRTWQATSSLYVTLSRPEDNHSIVGKGILHIGWHDFGRELSSFDALGHNFRLRLRTAASFLQYFTSQVATSFLAPLTSLQWPTLQYPGEDPYKKIPPSKTFSPQAIDGEVTLMKMWEPTGGLRDGEKVHDILFVPGAAVDHQIYALPTIKKNAIDYFTAAGYRCWSNTHRVGKTPLAHKHFTVYDARLDIAAALSTIRLAQEQQYGSAPEPIYVVAHCAGSIALSMGLLDGTIPASWLRGVTASNVFMFPRYTPLNKWKASLPVHLTDIYRRFTGSKWFDCTSKKSDAYTQHLLNQLLRFYPAGWNELCTSVACHRSELAFGRLWSHDRLNRATHDQLDRFLGGCSMTCLDHLVQMGLHGKVIDSDGCDLLDEDHLQKLQGLPIQLIYGTENAVFDPSCTLWDYERLRQKFGEQGYSREAFKGHGHLDCWMSETAAVKNGVFDVVRRKIDEGFDRFMSRSRKNSRRKTVGNSMTTVVNGNGIRRV